MNDHMELPVTHVFMMRDKEVIEQVLHYLANGHFDRHTAVGNLEEPTTGETP
jgi:hypothetical protein